MPQTSAIDNFQGEVVVITCEDYDGERRTDRNFQGELPPEELKIRLNKISEEIKQNTADTDTLKILMITHKVLAAQQGYERLPIDQTFKEFLMELVGTENYYTYSQYIKMDEE